MKHVHAFSLIEMLVALSLAAFLLALGAPSLHALMAQQQMRTAVNDLFAAIGHTRSLAISRGGMVLLAPLDPAGIDWAQGWVVFIDKNGNQRPDQSDELLFQHGPVSSGIAIASVLSSGHAPYNIAYNDAGRSCSATNSLAAQFGTLSLVQGRATRRIKINMLGRVRVCDPQSTPHTCAGSADAS